MNDDPTLESLVVQIEKIERKLNLLIRENRVLKVELKRLKDAFPRLGEKMTNLVYRSADQSGIIMEMFRDHNQLMTSYRTRLSQLEDWRDRLTIQATFPAARRTHLREKFGEATVRGLVNHFSHDDLNTLMHELRVDPGDYEGTRENRAHELVIEAFRRGFFWELVNKCRAKRPHYPHWPTDTGELK